MATIRNYNAWIKAARKAAKRTGGLSLPAARKAYRKMAAHVRRPLKGIDVKKHPVIFRRSIPRKSGGLPKRKPETVRKPVSTKRTARVEPAVAKPARLQKVKSLADFERLLDLMLQEDIEYASTAEY